MRKISERPLLAVPRQTPAAGPNAPRCNMSSASVRSGPSDWQTLLADPVKHWKTGYSARTLAHCWEAADGFPSEIAQALSQTADPLLANLTRLLAVPEFKVPPFRCLAYGSSETAPTWEADGLTFAAAQAPLSACLERPLRRNLRTCRDRPVLAGSALLRSAKLSLGRSGSVDGAQTMPMLYGDGLRHTLASHDCCSRGNPVGR